MHKRLAHGLLHRCAALSVVWLVACAGEVSGTPTAGIQATPVAGRAPRAADPSATAMPGSSTDACATSAMLREPRAVLASMGQYMNMLRDLLGPEAVSAESAAATGGLEFDVVDRARMSPAMLDRVLTLSEAGVATVRGRSAELLGCDSHDDVDCLRRGLDTFARRAFRRPLQVDELDALMALRASAASAGETQEAATLVALQAILVAPSTLYRSEFRGTPSEGSLQLSAHERADAIAALLLDSVPDPELLAAADDGSLATQEGVARQLARLLGTARVRQHLTGLILSAFKIPKLFETPKDGMRFPEYTRELQASMYEESRRFVEDVLWTRAAPLAELLESRRTFVDAKLASVYGVAAPSGSGFAPVELPEDRAGLLTQASVLSVLARTDKTSVVARGLFVRGPLLCLPKIPGPPAAVQAQVAAQLMEDASEPALAAYRAKTSPCNGCHSGFDPFGLLLEPFDAIGRSRPASALGADVALPAPLQGNIRTVAQLVQQAGEGDRFTQCLAQRTFAYALTEAHEPGTAACELASLQRAFAQTDGSMSALIEALVNDSAFWQRRLWP